MSRRRRLTPDQRERLAQHANDLEAAGRVALAVMLRSALAYIGRLEAARPRPEQRR